MPTPGSPGKTPMPPAARPCRGRPRTPPSPPSPQPRAPSRPRRPCSAWRGAGGEPRRWRGPASGLFSCPRSRAPGRWPETGSRP
eukprot:14394674-Heterocapsa_arctica.AAC.1